ncbi:MAG: hypothetical protein EOR30_31785 [Mesorhizobium sp.]|uniref:hypothetical protein n=2 Tax=Mesorhizobium sp. TaxID=1871066 RepID=UPI000FE5A3CF|nr:hypothetical protein [Mesorhizobium sp.]RWI81192.1 MAG: hypothetical protein EOR20_34165 [Mesorhizobium sp.]RWJ42422.1 MAG: hypothetical protein EOR30_31785 [Mesorhizobium sp.]
MSEHLLLAPLLESYFRRRLTKQRNATPATVASYRDALRMLILFAAARLRKKPAALALEELIEISFSLFSTNSRRSGTIPSPRATPAWPRSDLSSATSLPPTRHPSASPNAC